MLWKPTVNCVTTGHWTRSGLFALPFNDLLFRAQTVHRAHFDPNQVQVSTCCRSRPAPAPKTAPIARRARNTIPAWSARSCCRSTRLSRRPGGQGQGLDLFLHGRGLAQPDRQEPGQGHRHDCGARGLGWRPASPWDAREAAGAAPGGRRPGLLQPQPDTSPEFYGNVITTRTFQDRLDTQVGARKAGNQCLLGWHPRDG